MISGLTEKETNFIKKYLLLNDCGATTPSELLEDNFSCQTVASLIEDKRYSRHEVAGFISSLTDKGVLYIEDDRSAGDPDLYWVSDEWLKELEQDTKFENL